MEVLRSRTGFVEQQFHRAGVDLADIGSRSDRAAVSQALDDPHHRGFGKLAVLHQRSVPLAETTTATAAVQAADVLPPAHQFADTEISGPEDVEVGAILVGTGQL